jgi:hypothetical protein
MAPSNLLSLGGPLILNSTGFALTLGEVEQQYLGVLGRTYFEQGFITNLSLARSTGHLRHEIRRGRIQRLRHSQAHGTREHLNESVTFAISSWRR